MGVWKWILVRMQLMWQVAMTEVQKCRVLKETRPCISEGADFEAILLDALPVQCGSHQMIENQ